MRTLTLVSVYCSLFVVACSGIPATGEVPHEWLDAGQPDVVEPRPEDSGVAPIDSGLDDAAPDAAPPPLAPLTLAPGPATCASGVAPTAYLLTEDATLLTIDPTSLATHALGALACSSTSTPMAFTVSSAGTGFVLYKDESLYQVDLSSLVCSPTPYQTGQLGLGGAFTIAAGAGPSADRLYYGTATTQAALAFSDLETFTLFEAGPVGTPSSPAVVDIKTDPFDRMFALTYDGDLMQLDPSTGAMLGEDHTGFSGLLQGTALLAWEDQLLFFAGGTGNVSRYDIAAKTLTPLGSVSPALVGVSAAPCMAPSAPAGDAGTDGATGGADAGASSEAFAPGQIWIGNYACSGGVTSAALAVDTVSGNSITGRVEVRLGDPATAASYTVTGSYDASTREARFTAGGWVGQGQAATPPVGFDGFVSLGGQELSGNVSTSGCGAFSFER